MDIGTSRLYRVDYIKAAMNLEADRAQQLSRTWYSIFEPSAGTSPAARTAKVNSVRQNSDGTRLYIFEAWGEACDDIHRLDFGLWAQSLDRLDVREQWDVTRQGVDMLYQYTTANNSSRRNVTLYDSRPRSKRSGRDSGGYGLAIGSHKSDWRFTVYVRGKEKGACEFQCQGELVRKAWAWARLLQQEKGIVDNVELWRVMVRSLRLNAQAELSNVLGVDSFTIRQMVVDEREVESAVEERLANIEAQFDALPDDAKQAFAVAVQTKLFG